MNQKTRIAGVFAVVLSGAAGLARAESKPTSENAAPAATTSSSSPVAPAPAESPKVEASEASPKPLFSAPIELPGAGANQPAQSAPTAPAAPAAPAAGGSSPRPQFSAPIQLPGGSIRMGPSSGASGKTIAVPASARAGAADAAREAARIESEDRAEYAKLLSDHSTVDSETLKRAFNHHMSLKIFKNRFPMKPFELHYPEADARLPETATLPYYADR